MKKKRIFLSEMFSLEFLRDSKIRSAGIVLKNSQIPLIFYHVKTHPFSHPHPKPDPKKPWQSIFWEEEGIDPLDFVRKKISELFPLIGDGDKFVFMMRPRHSATCIRLIFEKKSDELIKISEEEIPMEFT